MVRGATPLSSLQTRLSKIWKGQRIWRWYSPSSESWVQRNPQPGIAPDQLSEFHLLASLLFSSCPLFSKIPSISLWMLVRYLLSCTLMPHTRFQCWTSINRKFPEHWYLPWRGFRLANLGISSLRWPVLKNQYLDKSEALKQVLRDLWAKSGQKKYAPLPVCPSYTWVIRDGRNRAHEFVKRLARLSWGYDR